MDDDPVESEFQIVRRLKHLSDRYKKGVRELRPMSEKLRDSIQKEIIEDWEKEQKEKGAAHGRKKQQDEEAAKERQRQEEQQRQSKKSNSNDQGHSHSH